MIGILAAVAKQERMWISGHVVAGLERARAQGRVGGRPKAEDDHKLVAKVRHLQKEGASLRTIAEKAEIAVNTVQRILAAAYRRHKRHHKPRR
jgi:DNA invertase Pin-like site-specific DNA recombinase